MSTTTPAQNSNYQNIERAIRYLAREHDTPPSLSETAQLIGLSDSHFQRLFSEWAGVSPKRFLQYLGKERAKAALRTSKSVLETSLDLGLSGPGRLHDLMVTCEAMTPGEIKTKAADLNIGYGVSASPFGEAFIAWTPRGICHFSFIDSADQDRNNQNKIQDTLNELRLAWPGAHFSHQKAEAKSYTERVFSSLALSPEEKPRPLHLILRGTNFQLKVWEALLSVKSGQLVSYSQLASLSGSPKASRAVGSALAKNTIAYLIPCHRVIRETGEIGQFRWGSQRKELMQAWEASHNESNQ